MLYQGEVPSKCCRPQEMVDPVDADNLGILIGVLFIKLLSKILFKNVVCNSTPAIIESVGVVLTSFKLVAVVPI